jgi:hypothetical protein
MKNLKTTKILKLILLTSLLIPFLNGEDKKYPSIAIEGESGKIYLGFEYPKIATNVVQVLKDYELYKKGYYLAKDSVILQKKLLVKQKKDLRREKIRKVFTIIGVALGASGTGVGVGFVIGALK